jgi:hypothetical protein
MQQRNLFDIGGVWIDETFDPKMPTVIVKAQSKAFSASSNGNRRWGKPVSAHDFPTVK